MSGSSLHRRAFLSTAGGALAGASALAGQSSGSAARPLTDREKLDRIASNTWPIRYIFKTRGRMGNSPKGEELKKKYGELTMLDFPDFTKSTFPGVYRMDLFSGLFGDPSDESMYAETEMTFNGNTRKVHEFDPSSASGRKWLEKM